MATPSRREWQVRAISPVLGGLLLASLAGCQWCPKPLTEQTADGAATAPPGSASGQAPQPGNKEPSAGQRRSLLDAERGQKAMVRCLQSERALTDGNELRCEDWRVVRDEFLRP